MANLSRSVAIVGVAESDQIGRVENKSSLQHHAEAAYNALEDAGLSISEVDGLLTAGFSTLTLAEYLGIQRAARAAPTHRPTPQEPARCGAGTR